MYTVHNVCMCEYSIHRDMCCMSVNIHEHFCVIIDSVCVLIGCGLICHERCASLVSQDCFGESD